MKTYTLIKNGALQKGTQKTDGDEQRFCRVVQKPDYFALVDEYTETLSPHGGMRDLQYRNNYGPYLIQEFVVEPQNSGSCYCSYCTSLETNTLSETDKHKAIIFL